MQNLRLIKTMISYEPIDKLEDEGVSSQDAAWIEKMCDQMLEPKACFNQIESGLLELKNKYPHVAKIENFLLACYQRAGQRNKCEALVREHYKKFPDYLFAKAAYARLIMDEERDWFQQVFGKAVCLEDLYPSRKVFHISEMLAFYSLVVEKLIAEESFKDAEAVFDMLEKYDYHADIVEALRPKMMIFKCMNKILEWTKKEKQPKNNKIQLNLSNKLRKKFLK